MNKENIILNSFQDLSDDFSELLFIIESNQSYLRTFSSSLFKKKQYIFPKTVSQVEKNVLFHEKQLNHLKKNLLACQKKIKTHHLSLPHLLELIQAKKDYRDLIRNQQGIFASLVTSTDWQSPSYAHSYFSQAGIQTGRIQGTINDYKRDQHINGREFETAYLREYVDGWNKFLIKVYATSSGMAAFTTILNFLVMEGKIQRKILVGKSSYFEYKELLRRNFQNRMIEIDESQTEYIIRTIKKEEPDAIFLDALCNSSSIALPDMMNILHFLTHQYEKEIYIVIDTSCLSISYQPMKQIIKKRGKVTLFCFESLNKYIQFGLDRTTGGIITAIGKNVGKLYEYRDHLGTNISDISVSMIPKPNRKLLETRLLRYQRNTFFLTSCLNHYIKIIFPRLSSHPSFSWAKHLSFQGSFFTISFERKSISLYKKFIDTVIKIAKKRGVDIVAGTSFGLSTTRVYLTSLRSEVSEPFIRIAVGTETRWELEGLKNVLYEAITSC